VRYVDRDPARFLLRRIVDLVVCFELRLPSSCDTFVIAAVSVVFP